MRKFYAICNRYGSETSVGFSNAWNVLVFESKESRDRFCKQDRLDYQPIKRSEIGHYIKRPNFFAGTAWFIDTNEARFDGEIGNIVVDSSIYPRFGLVRLY